LIKEYRYKLNPPEGQDLTTFYKSILGVFLPRLLTALYDCKKCERENGKEFLLLVGDVSGIQNFIYKIAQVEGAPGVSKGLRGRSLIFVPPENWF